MVAANTLLDTLANRTGADSADVAWYWRNIRERGLVPAGRRGSPTGAADVGAREAAYLLLACLSQRGARAAAEAAENAANAPREDAVSDLAEMERVSDSVAANRTFIDRLTEILTRIDEYQRVGRIIVSSVAVKRTFGGAEWGEINFFIENNRDGIAWRYGGGLHDMNCREVFASNGSRVSIEHIHQADSYCRECSIHGRVLRDLAMLIRGEAD